MTTWRSTCLHLENLAPSPYINRFVQPDTLIPDLSNPQSWNRYSYVTNRPVNFNDPTGHSMDDGCKDYGCDFGISSSTSSSGYADSGVNLEDELSGNGGSVGRYDYKPCDTLGINTGYCSVPATLLDGATIIIDFIALLISIAEAGTADAIVLGAIVISIFFPEAAGELIVGALKLDVEIAGALGYVENPLESVLKVMLQAFLACVANWQYTPYFRWILWCAHSREPNGDNGLTIQRFVRRPSGEGALENL